MPPLRLQKPLEKAIRSGHPWIFRNALHPFTATAGDVVTVVDKSGKFLCRGLADDGPIGVRVFLLKDIPLDESLFRERIRASLERRDALRLQNTTAIRLIHGEGDLLPGLTIDRYDTYAVLVCDGSALLPWFDRLVEILREELSRRGITTLLFRSRKRHEKTIETLWGNAPTQEICVYENSMKLWVDLMHGQKTGLFLDHRDSRKKVRSLSSGKRVLNLYGYTGGFSISAGLGGATHVTTVDIASAAIAAAQKSWLENNLDPLKHRALSLDVPEFMRADDAPPYDLIIADPPSFAPNKNAVPNALASYQKLHTSCMRRLTPKGHYIAASCSSHIRPEMFMQTLQSAARSCNKEFRIIETWGAAPDHPVLQAFPEGEYLKVYLVDVRAK